SISIKILEELSTRLNDTEMLMEEINAVDVERRVATYLINLVSKKEDDPISHPIRIVLPMSKTDLASFIGTSRETLSRKLSGFQQKGWIDQTKQRTITILRYNELRDRSVGNPSHVA
ncbi:MAG TPA: helix-turn-helix domain-containing protein, partial [Bacillales bacterium]|nr:helix-turn-helix domain-containing protein [Bacillales bacterium]